LTISNAFIEGERTIMEKQCTNIPECIRNYYGGKGTFKLTKNSYKQQWNRPECEDSMEADAFFFLIMDCEAIGTAATPGLLCQPRVIMKMIVEKQMECRLAGESEVLGENLPQRHFCPSQNPT
jgi:hypothetical protein